MRILGTTTGEWVMVGLQGLQVIIRIVAPNALEKWIDHSAFSKKRSTGGYKDAKDQEKYLKGALVEKGLAQ